MSCLRNLPGLVGLLLFVTVTSVSASASWRGTVEVEGMIHEPGGYHPYTTRVRLHLREGERIPVSGGFRVSLVSEDSTYHVETSVYQADGLLICSGTGTETLTGRTIGYLETKARQTIYHLVIPRAFGLRMRQEPQHPSESRRHHRAWRSRSGDHRDRGFDRLSSRAGGDERLVPIENARGAVRYEYRVSWSIAREP